MPRYQEVKYRLTNLNIQDADLRTVELFHDPINWENSERTIKRSPNFGVFTELSKNLVFTKEAKVFLDNAYLVDDIQANVVMDEIRPHPNTEIEYIHSSGDFHFKTWKGQRTKTKIQFKSGGLNRLVKAYLREKFDVDRLEAINGNAINPIDKVQVALTSREIFLLSELKNLVIDGVSPTVFNNTTGIRAPLMSVVSNSDPQNVQAVVADDFVPYNNTPALGLGVTLLPNPDQFFYFQSNQDKELRVKIKLDAQHDRALINHSLKAYIVRADASFVVTEVIEIYDSGLTPSTMFAFDIEQTIDLLAGENLAFIVSSAVVPPGATSTDHAIIYNELKLTTEEDSLSEDSTSQAVLIHEAYEQVMRILTGEENRFYSEFYGREDIGYKADGKFSLTGFASGFWIRGFNDKKMQMAIGGLFETSDAIHAAGYTIQKIDGVDKLVVEDKKFFFQQGTVIELPFQISEVEREIAEPFYNSSIKIGYKKGGDYEEVNGLNEYNVKNGYTLPIDAVDTTYIKESEGRADPEAKELARRKPKINFPTEDTQYDRDFHIFDLKTTLGTGYAERTWPDDFVEAPRNIFSPNTATNLRLTPFRMSERHQWIYGAGLTKFPEEYVRFSNEEGNSDLETKLIGETDFKSESGNVKIEDLEKPRFVGQIINFTHEVDFALNELIHGTTNVNGREIPNAFFKVKFINEFKQFEYGYIMEVKPQGDGKWKLIKAF